jgi:nucleoside-diphosphate-sugar epimerase
LIPGENHLNAIAVNPDRYPGMVCVVIGLGLLGGAIANRFDRCVASSTVPAVGLQLDWTSLDAVSKGLLQLLRERDAHRVEVIWSAGQAGFLSGAAVLDTEYRLFTHIISVLQQNYGARLSVNLLSSAGGVYEGTARVQHLDQVDPIRPYGASKLKQEQYLTDIKVSSRIFRLSSAYGPLRQDQRTGLLSVLMQRALDGGYSLGISPGLLWTA